MGEAGVFGAVPDHIRECLGFCAWEVSKGIRESVWFVEGSNRCVVVLCGLSAVGV